MASKRAPSLSLVALVEATLPMAVAAGGVIGAALLAGVGAGIYGSVTEAVDKVVHVTGESRPGPAVPVYAAYYPRYRALYAALAPEFKALAQVVSRIG